MRDEKPFKGLKVYYSGPIKGAPEVESDFPWNLVQYIASKGADVLSEHVASRSASEMIEIRARRIGVETKKLLSHPEPWFDIRKQDMAWVDEATHFIALVNTPSHGVGMEIERALLKPERGLPETPILCLVHESLINNLSFMIRGVSNEESDKFFVKKYHDLDDAKNIIYDFLTGN